MLIDTLQMLFERDLTKLRTEIELYNQEENLWRIEANIKNSAGNLALHLIGNLNTYIGAVVGKTNYARNRELEFSQKNVPREALIKQIEDTLLVIKHALNKLSVEDFEKEYPLLVWEEKTSTEYFLVHLTTHLSYHLGQINYHRRLIDG